MQHRVHDSLVFGQYKFVLLGIRWFRFSKGLLCLYILGKWRFGRVTPMPDTQTTEYRATQLVYNIKFKVSHAISMFVFGTLPLVRRVNGVIWVNRVTWENGVNRVNWETEVIGVNGVRAMNGMNWVNMMIGKNWANGIHLVIGVNWLNEVIEVIGVI